MAMCVCRDIGWAHFKTCLQAVWLQCITDCAGQHVHRLCMNCASKAASTVHLKQQQDSMCADSTCIGCAASTVHLGQQREQLLCLPLLCCSTTHSQDDVHLHTSGLHKHGMETVCCWCCLSNSWLEPAAADPSCLLLPGCLLLFVHCIAAWLLNSCRWFRAGHGCIKTCCPCLCFRKDLLN
jgi:hypothetical protein